MDILELIAGSVVVGFMGVLASILLWRIAFKFDLSKLLSEQNGDASLSRLQFLIFTFVISLSLFFVIAAQKPVPTFPAIPAEIFALLGISGASYLVSKGIQFSNPAGLSKPALSIMPTTAGLIAAGGTFTFVASLVNASAGAQMPALTWSLDAPAQGTLAPQPPASAVFTPAPGIQAGTTVTIRVQTNGYDDGTALYTY